MACGWTSIAVLLALLGAATSQMTGHPLHHPDRPGLEARLEWGKGSAESSAHCAMPPSLSLQLHVEGEALPLSLTRHLHVASSAPRYFPEQGRLSYSEPGLGEDHRTTYSDADQGATLVVACRPRPGLPVMLTVSGMVNFRGKLHHLEPLSSDVSDSNSALSYVLHPNLDPQTVEYATGPGPNEEMEKPEDDEAKSRRRRAVGDLQDKHIILDFIAVGEFHLYDKFLGWASGNTAAERRQNAVNAVQDYMAVNMASASNVYIGVDLDMNVNIDIRLQGFVVMESPSQQPEFTAVVDGLNKSDADALLGALRTWMTNRTAASSLPVTDGVVLFTSVDVHKNSNNGVAGIATTPSICESYGTALVEFEQYHTYFHVAHEIGHMLSARHDTPECVGGDMMSASVSTSKSAKDWRFSNCSIAAFKAHLGGLYDSKQNCVLGTFAASSGVTNYTQFPGAYIDLDRQCQLIKGPNASFCRACVPTDVTPEEICTRNQLPCRVGIRDVQNAGFPLPGTTCGNGKWCYKGQCVSSPLAPAKDESCLYGDQTAEQDFNNMGNMENCTTLIAANPGMNCAAFGKQCCMTCKPYETGIGDACKYVDPSGCGVYLHCGGDDDYICCNLCIYNNVSNATSPASSVSTPSTGSSSTASTTAPTASTASTAAPTASTASTAATTASTASTAAPTAATDSTAGTASTAATASTAPTASVSTSSETSTDSCADTDSAAGEYQNCAAMVHSARHLCYNSTLAVLCCRSCRQSASSNTGCTHGDRNPDLCKNPDAMQRRTVLCQSLSTVCCQTCAGWSQGTQLRSDAWLVLPVLILVSAPW